MDGSPDFRPEPARRASDPSFEEMLRRARDARLGDAFDNDEPFPAAYVPPPDWRGSRLGGWVLFAAGVLAGVLLSVCVVNVATTASGWRAEVAPAVTTATVTATAPPTATPVPTDTPTDSPTPFPTAITATELAALAQRYYDTVGPEAGTYVLMDTPALQTISADSTHMTLCVAYQYATVADPNTVVGSDARWFSYIFTNAAGWMVQDIGPTGSCSAS